MMEKRIFFLAIIVMSLCSGLELCAQTVGTGRESARVSMNFMTNAAYFATHPEPFVELEPENESDEEMPHKPAMTDPGQIRTRTTTSYSFGLLPSLPVSPSPTDTFQSTLDPGTSIPPDTHGAVDSNYCMTTLNSTVKIQTRAGGAVSSVTLNAFFNPINPLGGTFDPRVHYDPYAKRWIVVAVSGANNTIDTTSILIAVSQTSNPTGAWWQYIVRAYTPADYWFDYPDVGFNSKWITVTGNLFENSPGTDYGGAKVFAFNKASLYSGAGAFYTSFIQTSSSTIAPALTYDATLSNMFMVESWSSFAGQMRVWKLTGAVGSESMSSVGFPTSANRWQYTNNIHSGTSGDDFAPQAGTANKVQANDDRVTQLVYMNGHLWFAHTIFLPYSTSVNATRASVQWWETDTFAAPIQIGRIDDPTGTNFYTFPSMAVNTNNDALIGFSAFSATTFPSAAYALRMNTDPVDSMRPLVVYRHGLAKYYKTFSGTRNRWGDYSATCLDPLNNMDFWTLQEASSTPSGSDRWDTWWAYVQICNPPTATITPGGPTSFCTGGSVVLTATSGSGFTYQWQLGGSAISGATNISHTASTGGNYTVIVTNSSGCSATSLTTTVNVVSPPAATITPGGPTSFCTGGSVVLNANSGSGFTYQWQLGGTNIPGATNISFTTFASGNYTVIVTNSTGCSATSAITTVTVSAPPGATITPAGPTTFCSGGSVVLNANTGAGFTYQWTLGGTNISGATNSSHTASVGGNYRVVVTSAGCSSTSSITVVTVNSAPAATITPGGPTTFCSGGSVVLTANSGAGFTYQWILGGTNIGGATNISHTASVGGNYTVRVTNSSGCSTVSSITVVTVNSAPAATITPGGPTTFCTGGSVVLTANSGAGFTYQWRLGGSPIGGATNISHTASVGGNYTVIVTSLGCSTTSAITAVTVNSSPTATITPGGPTGFCTGGSVVLTANSGAGFTYQWQLGGSNISGATNISHTASTGGNYTVVVTSAGCSTTSAITVVSVNPPPGATITPAGPTTFCTGGNVVLNANTGAGFTYQWQLGGSPISGATNASHTATLAGNYTVIVTNVSCSSTSGITTVTITPGPGATITPAGPTTFCSPGSVVLNANTGAGISYQWNLGGTAIPGATASSHTASVAGDYTVTTIFGTCIVTSAITTVVINPTPTATITPDGPTTFCTPGSVTFDAPTGAGLTYQWQIGGSDISGATNSAYTATGAGNYTVIVTNGPCSATSGITTVTVSPGPPATITPAGPTAFCAGGSVLLNANTGSGLTYQWQLDGVNISGATASGYTASAGGDYTVIVFLGTCATTSAPTTITINPSPGATITPAGSTVFCGSGSVLLNANTGVGFTYQWRLGGVNITGATNDNFTATSAGNYTVVVTDGACSSTSAITTVVINPIPTAAITPAGPTTFCAGGSVLLNASTGSGYTYQWQLGGSDIPGATAVSYSASVGGNYTVDVTLGSCSATSGIVAVTVNSVSAAPITGPSSVCNGLTITLADATPGGVWSSGSTSVASVTSAGVVSGLSVGTAMISYSVTNPCGTAVATLVVTVNALPVVAPITGPSNVCVASTITLSTSTPSGVWSSTNPALATVGTTGVVTGVAAGAVTISYAVTNSSGCTAGAAYPVTVLALPAVSITPSGTTTFCSGGYVILNAVSGPGVTYQWQRAGADILGATSSTYLATSGGNYTVIATGSCTSVSAPVTVTVTSGTIVTPSVNITATPGPIFCLATSAATFTATAVNGGLAPSFQWLVNGVIVGSGASFGYTPTAGDIVSVVLTSNATCAFPLTATDRDTIVVSPPQTPSVSISMGSSGTVCSGDSITFSAMPVFGGTAPTYIWNRNGVNVATAASYRYPPANGDVLIVTMTSNYPCVTSAVAASSALVIPVVVTLPNTLTIYTTHPAIEEGALDTFVAVAPNAGSSPSFQWRINGVAVPGATTAMFITSTLHKGDVISCEVTSSNPCVFPNTKISSGLTIDVWPVSIRNVTGTDHSFTLVPNPNKGEFTIDGTLANASDENVSIVITNMLGQTIYSETTKAANGILHKSVTLSNAIANGRYLVCITSGTDHSVYNIVVER